MKISELIEALEVLQQMHGDLEVRCQVSERGSTAPVVDVDFHIEPIGDPMSGCVDQYIYITGDY